jgi:hypothetical protein
MIRLFRAISISLCAIAMAGFGLTIVTAVVDAAAKPSAINTPLVQTLRVKTKAGTFQVSAVSFDRRGHWKFMTDASNNGQACGKKCATKSLSSYVKNRRAVAGINGTYFGRNVFQYLVYNSFTKKVLNQGRAGKTPTAVFAVDTTNRPYLYLGTAGILSYDDFYNTFTFESKADGGSGKLRALLSHHPVLAYPGMVSLDLTYMDVTIKPTARTTRSAIGWNGKRFYLFVVKGASLNSASLVARAMGLDYALGLDGGGSSSLYANGRYIVGPGRAVPNAMLVTH